MKRFYEMRCASCDTIVEKWCTLEEIPQTPCPKCGKKTLKRKYSTFGTGSSCDVRFSRFSGG